MTRPTSWLPPAVWCHGAQSTITGGSSLKYASVVRSISWFAHHMRWVLMTAFGVPVEPDVNRNLAMVSGPTAAWAASVAAAASGVAALSISAENGDAGR